MSRTLASSTARTARAARRRSGPQSRRVLAVAMGVLACASVALAPPASAHHTACYSETRNPSPYGSVDSYASGSKALQFYVPVGGGGVRGTRVYFNPQVHAHGHSCLAWDANVGAQMQAQPHNEWLYTSVSYWNSSTRQWVVAGNSWHTNTYRTQSLRWATANTSGGVFTFARVTAWWWKDDVWSPPRSMTCELGRHGQSSYNCS